MPQIHVMIKPASGLCNMRCKYCFYTDEMEKRSGEPTLAGLGFYRKCLELEKKHNCNQVKISHALQTNGYVLDEEWCRFFAENDFLIGLSVDGIRATHDAYRKDAQGRDTYFHTLEAAKKLEAAGVDFNVLTVVNGKTAPKIRRIYEQYRKLGFCWQQYIACLDPILERQGQQEYSLTPKAYGQFLIDLFELWELDLKQGKQPYIRQFENYIAILLGQIPEACEQRGVCSLQNIVEADGSIYPCDFYVLDGYKLGNLNQDSFEEIEKRRMESGFVKDSLNSRARRREKIISAKPTGCFSMPACHACNRSRQRSAEGSSRI